MEKMTSKAPWSLCTSRTIYNRHKIILLCAELNSFPEALSQQFANISLHYAGQEEYQVT